MLQLTEADRPHPQQASPPAGGAEQQEEPFLHRGEPIDGNADRRQFRETPAHHLRSPYSAMESPTRSGRFTNLGSGTMRSSRLGRTMGMTGAAAGPARHHLSSNIQREENHLYEFVRDLFAPTPNDLMIIEGMNKDIQSSNERCQSLEAAVAAALQKESETSAMLAEQERLSREKLAEKDGQIAQLEAESNKQGYFVDRRRVRRRNHEGGDDGCFGRLSAWLVEKTGGRWQAACCCCCLLLLLLLLLLLIILLPLLLPGPSPPSFALGPNASEEVAHAFTLTSQLDRAGVQYYAVVPSAAVGSLLGSLSPADVKGAATGASGGDLEGTAVACGSSEAPEALVNLAVRVGRSEEDGFSCSSGSGGCLACPALEEATDYTVLAVLERLDGRGRLSPVATENVTTLDATPPSFMSGPSIPAVGSHSLEVVLSLDEPGTAFYSIYYDVARLVADEIAVIHSTLGPSSHQVVSLEPKDYVGGLAGSGSFPVPERGSVVRALIEPPCVGSLCSKTAYGLSEDTAYRIYVAAKDVAGNLQEAPSQLPFRTDSDTAAPRVLATQVNATSTSFSLGVALDRRGSVYFRATDPSGASPAPVLPPNAPGDSRRRLLQVEEGREEEALPGQVFPASCTADNGTACQGDLETILGERVDEDTAGEVLDTGCVEALAPGQFTWLPEVTGLQEDTEYVVYVVTEDLASPPTTSERALEIPVRTLDVTPPSFVNQRPFADQVWYTNFTLVLQIDEEGDCSYVVVPAGSPALAPTEVVSGAPDRAVAAGNVTGMEPFADSRAAVAGLEQDTSYGVYALCRDYSEPDPNYMEEPAFLPVTTADGKPPRILSKAVRNITGSTASLDVSLSEAGRVYYQVLPQGSAPPTQEQLFGEEPAPGAVDVGNFVIDIAEAVRSRTLDGLESESEYTVWVTAEDNVGVPNRMEGSEAVPFATPDGVPPELSASIDNVQGTSFDLSLELDEPGEARCLVVLEGAEAEGGAERGSSPPSAADVLNVPPQELFPEGLEAVVDAQFTTDSLAVIERVEPLSSETRFDVFCGARDSTGNVEEPPAALQVETLDVTPPIFAGGTPAAESIQEDSFAFVVQLDEPGTVYHVTQLSDEPPPSANEVRAGTGSGGALPVASGALVVDIAGEDGEARGSVEGLIRDTSYSTFFVAVDRAQPSPNAQPGVSSISVVTLDTTPPRFEVLKPRLESGDIFIIDVMLDEEGTAMYVCVDRSLPPPTAEEVARLQGPGGSDPVLSGTIAVKQAFTLYSDGLCDAPPEAADCDIWAVAEDFQTDPGPNRSPEPEFRMLNSTGAGGGGFFTCPAPDQLAARLRPAVRILSGSPGFKTGPIKVDANGTVFSQSITALNSRPPGSSGSASVLAGGLPVPLQGSQGGSPAAQAYATARLPPGRVRSVVRTLKLVSDLNSNEGRTLSAAYQVWDRFSHPQVSASGVSVYLLLEYAINRPPSQPPSVRLQGCAPFSSTTGIGQCTAALSSALFPAPGSDPASASVFVVVSSGGTELRSEPTLLQLAPPPTHPPLIQEIGMLATAPMRPLYPGEEFVLSVEANTGASPLKEWFAPIFYDTAAVSYVRFVRGPLWLDLIVTDEPSGGYVGLNCPGSVGTATPGQRTGPSVQLVDVVFRVNPGAAAAVVPSAVAVGSSGASVQMTSDSSLGATINTILIAQVRDRRGGERFDAEVLVAPVEERGVLAAAASSELFNTAVLDGAALSTSVPAFMVYSWSRRPDAPVAASSCEVALGSDAFSSSPASSGCIVAVTSSNTAGAGQRPLVVRVGQWEAEAPITVWFPEAVALSVPDPVLNRIVPSESSQGCGDEELYQGTEVYATADFGGEGLDTMRGLDVTGSLTFETDAPDVVQIDAAKLQGRQPGGPVTVRMREFGSVSASTQVEVSDEAVCVIDIAVVAFTGAAVSSGAPGGSGSLSPYQQLVVTFSMQQVLVREDDSALVMSYATFNDGAVEDITSRSELSSLAPEYLRLLPPDAATGAVAAVVTAALGSPGLCAPALGASWSVCGVELGGGNGPVSVQLPTPVGVRRFAAAPGSITQPSDPAAAPPISYATRSTLSVLLEFSDGQVIDFSRDPRTQYSLSGASGDRCDLSEQTSAAPGFVSASDGSPGAAGPCVVAASFPSFGNASLTEEASVLVVLLESLELLLLHYDVTSIRTFAPRYSPGPRPPRLRALACSPGDFQQATVWPVAELTDGTRHDVSLAPSLELSSSSDATVAFRRNLGVQALSNRLRPLGGGSSDISAVFAAAESPPLRIEADAASPVGVSSVALRGIVGGGGSWCASGAAGGLQCAATFLGIRGVRAPMEAEVELEDGFRYTTGIGRVLGQDREALDIVRTPNLLSFASDVPAAISVAEWGDASLLGNHFAPVGLSAAPQPLCAPSGGSEAAQGIAQVYANLEPRELDVDLGQRYGLQFQADPSSANAQPRAIDAGDTFTVPVVIGSATGSVEVFDIHINFDASLVKVVRQGDCVVGSDWPNKDAFVCVANSPETQVRINGVDANVAASMRGSRVEVARVTFTAQAPGLAALSGVVVEVKQSGREPRKGAAVLAGAGDVSVGGASSRRRLLVQRKGSPLPPPWTATSEALAGLHGLHRGTDEHHRTSLHHTEEKQQQRKDVVAPGSRRLLLPRISDGGGGSSIVSPAAPGRGLLQSCSVDQAAQVLGDVNFDCLFDLAGDVLAMDTSFGSWVSGSAVYYAKLAELSVNSGPNTAINSGVTDHQRSSLDPALRYYPSLDPALGYFPPSEYPSLAPDFLPRPDATEPPPLNGLRGYQERPGGKEDKYLLQLVKAGVQYFLTGVEISSPSADDKELGFVFRFSSGDSSDVADGSGIRIQAEVNSTQDITWTNPGADGRRSLSGNHLVTATFEGGGRWRVTGSGGAGGAGGAAPCSSFAAEAGVGLAFLVVTLDVNGDPINQSFIPYYGSSQKELYVPPEDVTYKDEFTPYSLFNIGATGASFLPGFPTAVDIEDDRMLLLAELSEEDTAIHYVVLYSSESGDITASDVLQGLGGSGGAEVLASGVFEGSPGNGVNRLQANVTGLPPGANVTTYMAVTDSGTGDLQGGDAVVVLGDILTRDVSPPVYEELQLYDGRVDEAEGTFELNLQVAMDEPAAFYWAVYRNYTCIVGEPSVEDIRTGATLQPPVCLCNGANDDCAAVDFGSVSNQGDAEPLNSTILIAGDLSPLPFGDLVNATDDELKCFTGSEAEASDSYNLYIWAEDDLPTFNTHGAACADRGSGASACGSVKVPCDQALTDSDQEAPAEGGLVNEQQLPFQVVLANEQIRSADIGDSDAATREDLAPALPTSSPLNIQFSLENVTPPAFTYGPDLPYSQQGPTWLFMELALDRPGLVTYTVSNFTASEEDVEQGDGGGSLQVGNGRVVVLNEDPGNSRVTVNITACELDGIVPEADYVVQVVARDKHGRSAGRVIRRLATTSMAAAP